MKNRMDAKAKLIINLILAVVWCLINGAFDFANFVFGFLLGFFIMKLVNRAEKASRARRYFVLVPMVLSFVFYFIKEVIKANLIVAKEVLSGKSQMTPGIVAIPLDVETDFQITLLANMISLTPGTFCMDVSSDRKYMYIHAMYIQDREAVIREIKEGFERRILEISQ